MASKQRSFFDPGHQERPRWHKNRRQQHVGHRDTQPVNPVPPPPPMPVSSKSRSKLDAFRFNKARKPEQPTESMNVFQDNTHCEDTHEVENIFRPPVSSTKSCVEGVPEATPETPVGSRVPLAELIGNNEDAMDQKPELTPVERVLWNQSPPSIDYASELMTPMFKRGTKRGRSSSPQSSSREEATACFVPAGKRRSFDLNNLQKSLATPVVDPAQDLWTRYSINTHEKPTPTKLAPQPLYDLLNSSSPPTPARFRRVADSGGLRRTMSCTTEWPTPVAKRRRIEKSHTQNLNRSLDAGFDHSLGLQNDPRTSKVSFLLEMIHDGLRDEALVTKDPKLSSSSPPTFSNKIERLVQFPPLEGQPARNQPPIAKVSLDNSQERPMREDFPLSAKNLEAEVGPASKSMSSDYGDDGVSQSFFNEVAASIQVMGPSNGVFPLEALVPEKSVMQTEDVPEPTNEPIRRGNTTTSGDKIPLSKEHSAISPEGLRAQGDIPEVHKSEDDFDLDDDDDFFAADLENLVALYDQRSLPDKGSIRPAEAQPRHPEASSPARIAAGLPDSAVENVLSERKYVELSDDDEFGGAEELEELAFEMDLVTQTAGATSTHNANSCSTFQRYIIVTVVTDKYVTDKGLLRPEKVLMVEEEKTKLKSVVILRQSWFDSHCTAGCYIHVIGTFDRSGQCIIDDAQNILILHPDHLISATVVADSFGCIRRAVLQDRVKATNESNAPQVYGHVLHEIFQEAMKANRWDLEWLSKTIETVTLRYLETLFEINLDINQALEHLKSKIPELRSWAEVFVTAKPRPDAIVKDRNGTHALMSINKLLDVEEHVWSPKYGLKGNVDATVQVIMRDGNNERTLTVPFEVKTGKNFANAAHKAQTALYTLLLSDRYDVEIAYGILYYMETSEISRIPAIRNELRHMIIQRNELACYVRQRLELPPMLKSSHLCSKCYAKTACFTYHKLAENGDGETSGMKEKFDEMVGHLRPVHQEFFKKWDDLLTKEEKDILKFRRELWTMLSSEREKVGRCFGNIVIEPGSAIELTTASKINRFQYAFIKQNAPSAFSFTDSQITVGEPIVISDERGHYALANGYVTHVRRHRITVAVDRRLHNARVRGQNFDSETNQSFTGVMEIKADGERIVTSTSPEPVDQILYRLDKDEFSNGMATVRNNLIRIMEKGLFGAEALRKLIVECVAPYFLPSPSNPMKFDTASQSNLNIDQRNAIEKVMCAKDYALVLGMPGTGKTTTIAHIIRALTAQGKSVLLTSYTHTAVDNILLKIRNDGIGILRLGAIAKVHPDVQEFADLSGRPKASVAELKESYGRQVVATTCLGINHPIFNQRIFDYCIVDEASQITLPVCLGPIRMARTFILVGDHYQLPPLVQNKEAQEGGLDISLFKLLSEKHPSSVVNLEHQYRMCEDIMSLSNTLIYDGRLKCGTPEVANRETSIPNMSALRGHHHSKIPLSQVEFCVGPYLGTCWIRDLLDPAVKVAFINTDTLLPVSREIAKGSRITNPIEATITTQLVESLLTVGVKATDIGVITLYRSQLALLKQNLRHVASNAAGEGGGAVEMHTADKFQGRDKEVIVLSLVRSNDIANIGDLLKDWRRVNVALTRARTKLLVVGSWDTIRKGNALLGRFCELVSERGWKVDMAKNALGGHLFEEVVTQATMRAADRMEEKDDVGIKKVSPSKNKRLFSEGKRSPEKKGKLDAKSLLGKRPVMRDIVNNAMA